MPPLKKLNCMIIYSTGNTYKFEFKAYIQTCIKGWERYSCYNRHP